MFLNLKHKRLGETIALQQDKTTKHPKTHRDESRENTSKQHKQIKSHRQHQPKGGSKKQNGITATSTIQSNNHQPNFHFKIKIKDPYQPDWTESLSRSQDKIESGRLERVTSAYRKVKKIDNNQLNNSYALDTEMSRERQVKAAKGARFFGKKEIGPSVSRNQPCRTQTDDLDNPILDKMNASHSQIIQELLAPVFELFSLTSQRQHERSYSHQQLAQEKATKQSNQLKKRSNQILIKDDSTAPPQRKQHLPMESLVADFYGRLDRAKEKMEQVSQFKKFKYVESPSITLFEKLYQDIETFVGQLWESCLYQVQAQLTKAEQAISKLEQERRKSEQKCCRMFEELRLQRLKCQCFQKLSAQLHQRNLYSTIFLNELSFGMDLDSEIRQKLYAQAKNNGLVSSILESQMGPKTHKSQSEVADQSNLYDNNESEFICYNLAPTQGLKVQKQPQT